MAESIIEMHAPFFSILPRDKARLRSAGPCSFLATLDKEFKVALGLFAGWHPFDR